MNTAAEIDDILRAKGLKTFDPQKLSKDSRIMTELYLSAAETLFGTLAAEISEQQRPKVHFRLTNHLGIDAFAAPLQGSSRYLVAMGYGVPANLHGVFCSLMSHPDILSGIGDSKNTICKFQIAPEGLLEFTYENPAIKKHASLERGFPLYNYPIDEDRMQYALLLTDIAMQYILYHEWGHVLYGHLSYLKHRLGLNEIDETGNTTLHADQAAGERIGDEPIRKVMEYNADYEASCMAARLPKDIQRNVKTGFLNYPKDFLERYDLRDAVVFSLLTLFHLFHEVREKKGKLISSLYPTPYLRFTSLFTGIYGNPEYDAGPLWEDYDYRGASEFANVSSILGFDLRFSGEMFDQASLAVSINQMLDQLSALNVALKGYQLS